MTEDNGNLFNYDNKHLIFKKIYDEISLVLKKYRMSEHTQIETLYLIIALKELGKEYWLDKKVLGKYFKISLEGKVDPINLNFFSIVVLLFYIENKVRYSEIKNLLKVCIVEKFEKVSEDNRVKTAELTLLFFDLLACPYLDETYKKKFLSMYGITDGSKQNGIIAKRKYWFTKWTKFDFGKELEAKKSQEVY
jgi:hypothetical protein